MNKVVDIVIKEDERSSQHDWDWSPKHTRLKYQMVTTCVIFFSVCVFTFTETSVPVLGWKIDGDVSGFVVFGMFVFSLIAIYSFYSRSIIEKKELSPSENYVYSEFKTVNTKITNLEKTLVTIANPDFLPLQKVQTILRENSNFIRENCASLAENAKILKNLPFLIDRRISLIKNSNELYSEAALRQFLKGETEEEKVKLSSSLFYENMQEPMLEKHAKIPDVKSEIEKLDKSAKFLEAISLHTITEDAFLQHISKAKLMIDSHEKQMESFVSKLQSTIVGIVSLNDTVAEYIREGEKGHREISFDRKWLSYRIPLIISVALLVVGVPFGIGKVASTLLQQKYCWCFL